jgi:hypothetical protein
MCDLLLFFKQKIGCRGSPAAAPKTYIKRNKKYKKRGDKNQNPGGK